MEDRVSVWPDDVRELTGLGGADHGELNSLIVVLEKVSDVGSIGDEVDVHIGIATPPVLHLAGEIVTLHIDEGLALTEARTGASRNFASCIACSMTTSWSGSRFIATTIQLMSGSGGPS